MSKVVIFLVCSFIVFQSAHVIAAEHAPFAEAFKLLLKDKLSQKERITVAKGFEDLCGQIKDKIPTLSPSEGQWLDAEIQAGRVMSLLSSVELAKRTTRLGFGNCSFFGTLLSSKNSFAVGEAFGWSKLLQGILTPHLSYRLEILNKKNVANFSQHELVIVSNYSDIANRVLGRIIIPLLNSEIEKRKKN